MSTCGHTAEEQDRAVAMDFATRLRSVETPEQAIAAAERLLAWLHPQPSAKTLPFQKR